MKRAYCAACGAESPYGAIRCLKCGQPKVFPMRGVTEMVKPDYPDARGPRYTAVYLVRRHGDLAETVAEDRLKEAQWGRMKQKRAGQGKRIAYWREVIQEIRRLRGEDDAERPADEQRVLGG